MISSLHEGRDVIKGFGEGEGGRGGGREVWPTIYHTVRDRQIMMKTKGKLSCSFPFQRFNQDKKKEKENDIQSLENKNW